MKPGHYCLVPKSLALSKLSPLVGMGVVVVVYRGAYASEDGRYAGAEPAIAGLLLSAPFAVLLIAQTCCVAGTYIATSPRRKNRCAQAALLLTFVGIVAALALL